MPGKNTLTFRVNNAGADLNPVGVRVEGLLAFARPGGVLPGDYNTDGKLDVADLDLESAAIKINSPLDPYDENNDGQVNGEDRKIWVKNLKKTWIGDADLNFEFNSTDLINVFVAGKYETGATASWSEGDFNGDMSFGSSDLVDAFVDGGYELGPPPPAELPIMPVSTQKYRSTDISGNYADMAKAFGGYGERVSEPDQIVPAIERGIKKTREGVPVLPEFITAKETEIASF